MYTTSHKNLEPQKTMLALLKRGLYEQIFRTEGRVFEKIFNLVNNVYLKWPISVIYDAHSSLYEVIEKEGGDRILIGRHLRVPFYRKGIAERLRSLCHEYLLDDISFAQDDIVIDVGANVGELSLHLAQTYQVDLICIEPEQIEFNCLRANCGRYNSTFLNLPLWSEEKQMTFYQKNSTGDSSLFETLDCVSQKSVLSSTLSRIFLSNIFINKRVRCLKLEAEGAEPEILIGGLDVLHRIDYIAADVGPERGLRCESTAEDVKRILLSNGFELIRAGHKRQTLLFKNVYT